MLRVGVAGCGYWGSKHIRVLSSLAGVEEVVAIDPHEGITRRISAQFPSVRTESSLEDALPSLDALIIATPAGTHAELAMAALESRVSVLVEKPLATSTEDATRMCHAALRNDVTLMVGHTFEYNAAVVQLRQLVRSGELGDMYYLDTARLNLGLYQSDVNVVWDLAPHDLSILNYVLGHKPSSVRAWGSRHANRAREDVAFLQLQYGDQPFKAQVHVSWLNPSKVRRVTVVGSQKMAVYNDLNVEERLRVYDKGILSEPGDGAGYPVSYRYGAIMSPYIEFAEPLEVEDKHFLQCVVSGERPQSDGWSGLAVVQVLEAAELSLAIDEAVKIDPVLETVAV